MEIVEVVWLCGGWRLKSRVGRFGWSGVWWKLESRDRRGKLGGWVVGRSVKEQRVSSVRL